jgi:hypothetical protein
LRLGINNNELDVHKVVLGVIFIAAAKVRGR